jgi:hypothetical protein
MKTLRVAVFGIFVFLVSLLFVSVAKRSPKSSAGHWAFLLSGLLTVLGFHLLRWVYTSFGWPGTSIGLFTIGTLFLSSKQFHGDRKVIAFLMLFTVLNISIYHHTAAIIAVFLWVLLLYTLIVTLLFRTWGQVLRLPIRLYFALAVLSLASIYFDPLFADLASSGISRPWEGVRTALTLLFQRGRVTVFTDVYFSFLTRLFLTLPFLSLTLVGAWLWTTDHLVPMMRRRLPNEEEVLLSSLYLTAVALPIIMVVSGGGLYTMQANYLLIVAVPTLLVAHIVSRRGKKRVLLAGTLTAVFLLLVTIASTVVVMRDPWIKFAEVQGLDSAVVRWASKYIRVPYFADDWYTGLVLDEDYNAQVVPLGVDSKASIYSGPEGLARILLKRGAAIAVLGDRNIDKAQPAGFPHAIILAGYGFKPLPDYDLDAAGYDVFYANGGVRVLGLPGARVP